MTEAEWLDVGELTRKLHFARLYFLRPRSVATGNYGYLPWRVRG